MKMSAMDWVIWVLLFVGGLNWGLVGVFKYNLVESLLGGPDSSLVMIVYILVGLAAVWSLVSMFMKGNNSGGSTM